MAMRVTWPQVRDYAAGERRSSWWAGWADGGYSTPAGHAPFPARHQINSLAEDNYNDADTYGARAALKIDLNDNWSITPTVIAQKQESNGIYAGQSDIGDREVTHWHPEGSDDQWMQAALAVEGKMSNFDITFSSSYLKRDVEVQSDYSDYSFFYDTITGGSFSAYFLDNDGDFVNPSQYINGTDKYTKASHELRFTTNPEARVRFVGGVFFQRQTHDIQQEYRIDNLSDDNNVTGWDDVFWLTKQWRVDRDEAVFGELSFDLTDRFTLTGGLRQFQFENCWKTYASAPPTRRLDTVKLLFYTGRFRRDPAPSREDVRTTQYLPLNGTSTDDERDVLPTFKFPARGVTGGTSPLTMRTWPTTRR